MFYMFVVVVLFFDIFFLLLQSLVLLTKYVFLLCFFKLSQSKPLNLNTSEVGGLNLH